MKNKHIDLLKANSDIILLLETCKEIGWSSIKEQTVHRLMYLTSVLHTFMYKSSTLFDSYHFSISVSGPYSSLINDAIVNLKTRELLIEHEGKLAINVEVARDLSLGENEKKGWFQIIVYLLGIYGENKIFGFVIQDPEYKDVFQRNSVMELDITSDNKTISILNQFKLMFEETLSDVSSISDREYLELYFEYVFSKIIKKID